MSITSLHLEGNGKRWFGIGTRSIQFENFVVEVGREVGSGKLWYLLDGENRVRKSERRETDRETDRQRDRETETARRIDS